MATSTLMVMLVLLPLLLLLLVVLATLIWLHTSVSHTLSEGCCDVPLTLLGPPHGSSPHISPRQILVYNDRSDVSVGWIRLCGRLCNVELVFSCVFKNVSVKWVMLCYVMRVLLCCANDLYVLWYDDVWPCLKCFLTRRSSPEWKVRNTATPPSAITITVGAREIE